MCPRFWCIVEMKTGQDQDRCIVGLHFVFLSIPQCIKSDILLFAINLKGCRWMWYPFSIIYSLHRDPIKMHPFYLGSYISMKNEKLLFSGIRISRVSPFIASKSYWANVPAWGVTVRKLEFCQEDSICYYPICIGSALKKRKTLLYVFKSLNGLCPQYITDCLVVKRPPLGSVTTSSCHGVDLLIPKTTRRSGDRAYSVAAATLWNN